MIANKSMLQLQRKEAIELLSFVRMFALSDETRLSTVEDALAEAEVSEATDDVRNRYLRQYLQEELELVTNNYLEQSLRSAGYEVSIFDLEPLLHACPICSFETLEKRGEYFICDVCFWEDDGISELEPERYSGANRMTFSEAREHFRTNGTTRNRSLPAYDDRQARFRKQGSSTLDIPDPLN